jgi:23S rRNA pseudouridine2605 synthase
MVRATKKVQKMSERIAKVIAASGLCSRREAERWIQEGRVMLNGIVLKTPAVVVEADALIQVDGKPLTTKQTVRLWRFHKPRGTITSHKDEQDRPTIFDILPPEMKQLHSIGRLDYQSEGLLLLTNDGALKRQFELPSTGLKRCYRVRVYGIPSEETLMQMRNGVTIEGMHYQAMEIRLEKEVGVATRNCWLKVVLREGKNREIRRIFEHFEHPVNRLIRTQYDCYRLDSLPVGAIAEVQPPLQFPLA